MHPSTFDRRKPITADDAAIEAALGDAHIPSLMAALVHLRGDASIIRGDIRPSNDLATVLADARGGITEQQQATIRKRRSRSCRPIRDGGGRLPPAPSEETVREIMGFMIGQPVPPGPATSTS